MYESHQIAVDAYCKRYYLINDLTNIEWRFSEIISVYFIYIYIYI